MGIHLMVSLSSVRVPVLYQNPPCVGKAAFPPVSFFPFPPALTSRRGETIRSLCDFPFLPFCESSVLLYQALSQTAETDTRPNFCTSYFASSKFSLTHHRCAPRSGEKSHTRYRRRAVLVILKSGFWSQF